MRELENWQCYQLEKGVISLFQEFHLARLISFYNNLSFHVNEKTNYLKNTDFDHDVSIFLMENDSL